MGEKNSKKQIPHWEIVLDNTDEILLSKEALALSEIDLLKALIYGSPSHNYTGSEFEAGRVRLFGSPNDAKMHYFFKAMHIIFHQQLKSETIKDYLLIVSRLDKEQTDEYRYLENISNMYSSFQEGTAITFNLQTGKKRINLVEPLVVRMGLASGIESEDIVISLLDKYTYGFDVKSEKYEEKSSFSESDVPNFLVAMFDESELLNPIFFKSKSLRIALVNECKKRKILPKLYHLIFEHFNGLVKENENVSLQSYFEGVENKNILYKSLLKHLHMKC